MISRRNLTTFFLHILYVLSIGSLATNSYGSNVVLQHYVQSESTPMGKVHDVVRTNHFTFLAAENGLFLKQNGQSELLAFTKTNSSLGTPIALALEEERAVWIATAGLGLFHFDLESFASTKLTSDSVDLANINNVEVCGRYLVVNSNTLVHVYDLVRRSWIYDVFVAPNQSKVSSITCDTQQFSFIFDDSVVTQYFFNLEKKAQYFLNTDFARLANLTIAKYVGDFLYVGGHGGIYRKEKNTWSSYTFARDSDSVRQVTDISEHPNGTVFIAAGSLFELKEDTISRSPKLSPLLEFQQEVFIDQMVFVEGNELLLTVDKVGVVSLPVETLSLKSLLEREKIKANPAHYVEEFYAISHFDEVNLWLGQHLYLDVETCTVKDISSPAVLVSQQKVQQVLCGAERYLSIPYANNSQLVFVSHGYRGTFYEIDASGFVVDKFHAPSSTLKHLLFTRSGELVAVDDNGHLYVQKSRYQWLKSSISEANSLSVTCLYERDSGVVSLCTDGEGVIDYHLKDAEFSRLSVSYTGGTRFIRGAISDGMGMEVFATNTGLFAHHRSYGISMPIGKLFGVLDTDFNENGVLTAKGNNAFVFGNQFTYQLDLTAIALAFESQMNVENEIHATVISQHEFAKLHSGKMGALMKLPSDFGSLTIDFNVDTFIPQPTIGIEYRILPDDEQWHSLKQGLSSLTLDSLPPGEYEFEVRAVNKISLAKQPVTALKLHVLPPLWASWKAQLVYCVLLLSFFVWVWQRLQKDEKRERLKARKLIFSQREDLAASQASIRHLLEKKHKFLHRLAGEISTPAMAISSLLNEGEACASTDHNSARRDVLLRHSSKIIEFVEYFKGYDNFQNNRLLPLKRYALAVDGEAIVESLRPLLERQNIAMESTYACNKHAQFVADTIETIVKTLFKIACYLAPNGGKSQLKMWQEGLDFRLSLSIDANLDIQPISVEYADKLRLDFEYAKYIASVNNGYLSLSQLVSKSTSFQLSLPISELTVDDYKVTRPKTMVRESPAILDTPYRAKTVLILEESNGLREVITHALKSQYTCYSTPDLVQAEGIVASIRPDLVIADFNSRSETGLRLLQSIRGVELTSKTPFIMLSNVLTQYVKQMSMQSLADLLLEKPISNEDLLLNVDSLFARSAIGEAHKPKPLTGSHIGEVSPTFANEKEQSFYLRFVDVICKNFNDESFNRHRAAELLYISERQLNRKLKSLDVENFSEYLKRFRLEQAKRLLVKGKGVSDVAYTVGFSTPSYFTSCFKQNVGKTPSQYRNEHYGVESA